MKDLTVRTPGEELWCRRRAAGLTTAQAAALLGVGRRKLCQLQRATDPLKTALPPPGMPQLLALARRRQGWTLRQTAERLKISHVTLLRREAKADPDIIAFWVKRGFTFAHD